MERICILVLVLSITSGLPSSRQEQNNSHHLAVNGSNEPVNPKYLINDTTSQAYVSGGSLVSFASNVNSQERSDLMDSILYAEQTAGLKYDKIKHFEQWYQTYCDILRKISWDLSSVTFQEYEPKQTEFKLSNAIYTLLAPTCQTTQKKILSDLFSAWQSLKDFDKAVTSFLSHSSSTSTESNAANFQIMPAVRGQPGEVLIVFGAFYYHSLTTVERFLSYLWPSNYITLHYSVEVARLTSSKYSTYRNVVRATLADRAYQMVQHIKLEPNTYH